MSAGKPASGPIDRRWAHQLELLMADPKFQKALRAYRREDDRHDVAYLAGSETDGKTIDFDKHFAQAIEEGHVRIDGKPIDPRPVISVHEAIEGAVLRHQFEPGSWILPPLHGKSYPNPAHDLALIAERQAAEHAWGPGCWDKYNAALKPYIKEDEAEVIHNPPPKILRMPYEGTPKLKPMTGGARAPTMQQRIPTWREIMFGDRHHSMFPEGPQSVGARLSYGQRKALPSSSFVFPGKRAYPIDTPNRARNALSRGAQNASPAQEAKIRAAVHRKYPSIGQQAGARAVSAMHGHPTWGHEGTRVGPSVGHGAAKPPAMPAHMFPHDRQPWHERQTGARGPMGPVPAAPNPMPMAKVPPGLKKYAQYQMPKHPGMGQAGARHGGVGGAPPPKLSPPHHYPHGQQPWHERQVGARHPEEYPAKDSFPVGARSRHNPGPMRYPGHDKFHQVGAHGDEREDRALFERMWREHEGKGKQSGARMPNHMHALSLASANHLHNMGHINSKERAAIHAKTHNHMAMNKAMAPPTALPMNPLAGPPTGGFGEMNVPSFGSMSPPGMM